MGYHNARDMAAHADLDTALRWHLTANHYPPLPVSLIEPAKRAIQLYADGDVNADVELPVDVRWRGQTHAPAWACVEAWHLGAFVDATLADPGDDDDDDATDCGSCGADLGPSRDYPWHWPDEDCRAVREPLPDEGEGDA